MTKAQEIFLKVLLKLLKFHYSLFPFFFSFFLSVFKFYVVPKLVFSLIVCLSYFIGIILRSNRKQENV
jgi:hypothetical protein